MAAVTSVAPQRVLCVLDHAGRDLAVADHVVAGRFPVAGLTLMLGATPNWRVDPHPDDKEWRIEWTKFYYGLDLAHAFAVTGDRRYRDAWARLVTSFVAQVPSASDDVEVMARRIQNWIYAWNRFAQEGADAAPLGDAAAGVADYLWREVQHVRAHLTKERNHRTLELYGLFVAALAFPCLDDGHELRDFAFEQLHQNLLADIWPDGVHRECSTHYHCIVLRSFLGALHNARVHEMAVPASFLERVTLACEFALHCHRPDGAIPACSDADSESYADVLALAGTLLDRPDFTWAATRGREGRVPDRRHASFARGGYHTLRSGWGTTRAFADERFLIFDCGPLGDGGHGHYDALSVEIAAHGRPLLIDPGRYSYSEAGDVNWRRWFKGTAAHNTVCVDGLDQTPYWRRKPKAPVATARLLARGSSPGVELLLGETRSPAYDAVHRRAVLFVNDEYWLIVDTLHAPTSHAYELRWHLPSDAGNPSIAGKTVAARGCVLAFAGASSLRLEPGWQAPLYGVKQRAPVIVASAAGTGAVLVTALVPTGDRAAGTPLPALRVVETPHGDAGRVVIEVVGTGVDGRGADTVSWAIAPGPGGDGNTHLADAFWRRA